MSCADQHPGASPRFRAGRAGVVVTTVLALAPMVGLWTYKVIVHPRPFWVHFYDPEMIYYYCGRDLVSGRAPAHYHNPGAPCQWLSAGIQWVIGSDPCDIDCFRYWVYGATLLANIGAGLLLLRTLLVDLHPALRIAAMWTYWLCPGSLEYLAVWAPETLIFSLGSIAMVFCWRSWREGSGAWSVLLAGMAVGVCCSLKFVFAPWTIALVVTAIYLARSKPNRSIWLAAAVGGIVLGFAIPSAILWPHYPQVGAWLWRLVTRAGPYGTGSAAVPEVEAVANHVMRLLAAGKIWHGWLGFLVAAAIASLVAAARRGPIPRPDIASVLFAIVALAAGSAILVRTAEHRYFLPAGLCGVMLMSANARIGPAFRLPAIRWVLLLAAGAGLARHAAFDIHTHRSKIMGESNTREQIDAALHRLSRQGEEPIIVYGWRAPAPSFALRFFATDTQSLRLIESRYPHEGHYDQYTKRIHLPSSASTWDVVVLRQEHWAVFEGRHLAGAVEHEGDYVIAWRDPRPPR